MKRGYTKKEIEGLFSALFENQLPIIIEESKKLTAGQIIPVKISHLKNHPTVWSNTPLSLKALNPNRVLEFEIS